jgi:hypothetical protein
MAITEAERHAMATKLEEILGEVVAMTLMEHLPPVGWGDVATRRDLDALERAMHLRFEAVDRRFDEIDRRFEVVDRQFEALDHRFEALDHRFAGFDDKLSAVESRIEAKLHEGFAQQTRHLYMAVCTSMLGFGSLVLAAAQLA